MGRLSRRGGGGPPVGLWSPTGATIRMPIPGPTRFEAAGAQAPGTVTTFRPGRRDRAAAGPDHHRDLR
ncbi:hypothetical protein AB0H12_23630 [Actinosynnema sp. NPDC023794]